MADELKPVTENPWSGLRRLTPARIALGRSGGSLPTREVLDFQLAHARARDAVHLPFDSEGVARSLARHGHEVLRVRSAAPDRSAYLQRPDLGRRLGGSSRASLEQYTAHKRAHYDAAFVVADGLSALAVHTHAVPLVTCVADALATAGWRLAPLVVAEQGRVALGDEIGALLGAAMVAVLIGERPGLSAADSLGVYLTFAPRVGRTDAERNCLSNIRPEGLSYHDAARKLLYLMREARRLQRSGVDLKDDSDLPPALPE